MDYSLYASYKIAYSWMNPSQMQKKISADLVRVEMGKNTTLTLFWTASNMNM